MRTNAAGPSSRRVSAIALGIGGVDLPVLTHTAAASGPSVAVTANVHGDEVTGLAAVHDLDRTLATALKRGSVVLFPSLNPSGLVSQRRANGQDGLDLNRAFPGNPDGTGSDRVAGRVWEALMALSLDALIDLHADSAVAIPYAIVDRPTSLRGAARQRMEARLDDIAGFAGLTLLHEYPDAEYVRYRLDQSLAGAMVNRAGVCAVTLEVGPRRAVFADAVRITADAVLRILRGLGLVDEAPAPSPGPIAGGPWHRGAAPRVGAAGVFVPAVRPGARFVPGDVLGEVRGVDGTVRQVVRAVGHGLVVSWSEHAWIDERGVPGTLGVRSE